MLPKFKISINFLKFLVISVQFLTFLFVSQSTSLLALCYVPNISCRGIKYTLDQFVKCTPPGTEEIGTIYGMFAASNGSNENNSFISGSLPVPF